MGSFTLRVEGGARLQKGGGLRSFESQRGGIEVPTITILTRGKDTAAGRGETTAIREVNSRISSSISRISSSSRKLLVEKPTLRESGNSLSGRKKDEADQSTFTLPVGRWGSDQGVQGRIQATGSSTARSLQLGLRALNTGPRSLLEGPASVSTSFVRISWKA